MIINPFRVQPDNKARLGYTPAEMPNTAEQMKELTDRAAQYRKKVNYGAASLGMNSQENNQNTPQNPTSASGLSAGQIQELNSKEHYRALAPYLTKGKGYGHLNFNSNMGTALGRFLAAGAKAGHNMTINSGYRTYDHQASLFRDAQGKYGKNASHYVAPPGRSQHNHGNAADLGYETPEAQKWAHTNAAQFGLNFRMGHEPWHIELGR